MTRADLKRILDDLKVRTDMYGLSGYLEEAYCLSQETDGWHVFYGERGLRTGDQRFPTEHAACCDLLCRITDDPLTRAR